VVREKEYSIQKAIQVILTAGMASYAHDITQRLARAVQRQAKEVIGVSSSIHFTRPSADGRSCSWRAVMRPAITPTERRGLASQSASGPRSVTVMKHGDFPVLVDGKVHGMSPCSSSPSLIPSL
jgi:hypothetical protein